MGEKELNTSDYEKKTAHMISKFHYYLNLTKDFNHKKNRSEGFKRLESKEKYSGHLWKQRRSKKTIDIPDNKRIKVKQSTFNLNKCGRK